MRRILIVTLFVAFLFSSCNKFIDVDDPRIQVEQSKIFEDEEAAVSAVSGLYYQLTASNRSFLNGAITGNTGLYSDEIFNTAPNPNLDAFLNVSLTSTNSQLDGVNTFWVAPYNYIYHANAIIEGLEQSSIAVEMKKQLKGEALFIRSVIFFYLVNIFGDVPLVLTASYQTNELLPRESYGKALQQIAVDLKEASILLKEEYPSSTRLRANRLAALALLARIYLYQGQWQLANETSRQVTDNPEYHLESLNEVFLSTSEEAVLQLSTPPSSPIVTGEGYLFNPLTAVTRPSYSLTDTLVGSFEPGDNRFAEWTRQRTISGKLYTYPYKYKLGIVAGAQTKPEHITLLRLAEQLLIQAESKAQLGLLPEAIADLDKIRGRAGLPPIGQINPGLSKEELLNVILHERQVELFCEFGHRFFDLKRTGRIDKLMPGIKPNWMPYKAVWPIPASQLRTNPNLTQNPGYQN